VLITECIDFLNGDNNKIYFASTTDSYYACPHCNQVLEHISANNEGLINKCLYPGCIYNDGDAIAISSKEAFAGRDRFDVELCQGKCIKCKKLYCSIFLYVTSRPIKNFNYEIFVNNGDMSYSSQYLFVPIIGSQVKLPFPWRTIRYADAYFMSDPDKSFCYIDSHLIGPFPLSDSLAGPMGVASCPSIFNSYQENIWDLAKQIVLATGPIAFKFANYENQSYNEKKGD